MNVQYSHNRSDTHIIDATFALEVPTKEFLEKIYLTHSTKAFFCAGISVKSKKDVFTKKIGRDLAKNRMSLWTFTLDMVDVVGTTHAYHFSTPEIKINDKIYRVSLRLTTIAEHDKVKLVGSIIEAAPNE